MKLSKGRMGDRGLKIVVYGPAGIGKSTFASQFPDPIFIDTEGGTVHMDVVRVDPLPQSWAEIKEIVRQMAIPPYKDGYQTLIIDTADWAEKLCKEAICAEKQWKGMEDAGYGRSYTYLAEAFGKLLNSLEDIAKQGKNVVVTAHAMMRKFEQPDEMGSYDRWELKLEKKVAPLVKEWADLLLFANYKTMVINVDDKGAAKGKNKVQGGQRVMYASHHPCWDAKNRFGLPDEMPFRFDQIAHILPAAAPETSSVTAYAVPPSPEGKAQETTEDPEQPERILFDEPVPFDSLRAMMEQSGVTCKEVRLAVAQAGYYPEDTPIATYDATFVSGELLPNWAVVVSMIKANRDDDTPF